MTYLVFNRNVDAQPGMLLIANAIRPFVPQGDALIFMEESFTLSSMWHTKVTIQFPKMPWFDFEVLYTPEEFNELRFEPGALSTDFGFRVAEYIRTYRIEPDAHIELGEN